MNQIDPKDTSDIGEVEQIAGPTPLAPAHGIAALALQFALKYCDINTVQDGALYQQYKLEGRNITDFHMGHVLWAAKHFEAQLMSAPQRLGPYFSAIQDACYEDILAQLDNLAKEDASPPPEAGSE